MATNKKFEEFHLNDDITIYVERLEQYFLANDLTEEKKVANLLSCIGITAYKLLRNLSLPKLPKEESYDELINMLKEHCCPRINVWRERRKFYNSSQTENEKISEWSVKLMKLSENCNFGTDLNKVLCDKFVTGLYNDKIFEKLCEEKADAAVKFKKLKELAINKEDLLIKHEEVQFQHRFQRNSEQGNSRFPRNNDSQRQHRSLVTRASNGRSGDARSTHSRAHSTFRPHQHQQAVTASTSTRNENGVVRQQGSSNCRVCGLLHRGKCRFQKSFCNICKVKGHIARVCRKKHVNFINNHQEQLVNNANKSIFSNLDTETDDSLDNNEVNNPCNLFQMSENSLNKENNQFNVQILINKIKFTMLFDSGSSVSCMSLDVFNKYFSKCNLIQDNTVLRSYNGSMFAPKGYFLGTVIHKNKVKQIKFHVVDSRGPCILGRDFVRIFDLKFQMVNQIQDNKG